MKSPIRELLDDMDKAYKNFESANLDERKKYIIGLALYLHFLFKFLEIMCLVEKRKESMQ